ncbi:MAG: Pvc16 family protein [Pleurocapsa sp. MO_226.B13]|nr:Pvc16 family protein [Pleurocapsa sp. MO_226.B13]
MIRDLSMVLKRILEDSRLSPRFPELAEAQISFERPSETFSPGQTTVNLFLYDIREHLELRSNEPSIEMRGGQAIIHHPPKRIACSYLVTAWPVGGAELPLQEHRLLSQVLQVFSAYPIIPERQPFSFLDNTRLSGQEPPLPMLTAQVDGLQSAAEFWTALGNQLRPSITVTVTFALEELLFEELFAPKELTPIVFTRNLQLSQQVSPDAPATEPRLFWIGGRVTDAGNQPVVGATVRLVEPVLSATTDGDGQYRIGAIPRGTYTLRVELDDLVQEVNIDIPVTTIESNYNVELQQ